MNNRPVYQLSARQILTLAFGAALMAAVTTAIVYSLTSYWKTEGEPGRTFAESMPSPAGISEPAQVTDEQNSIEVYKAISPGVAFVNTTAYRQDMFGDLQEGRGNGSGSVIDSNGHILTNFHVVESAQKLTVSFGGDKVYPARVIGGDPDTDLAIIKIEPPPGMTVVPLGDSDNLVVGQKVLAIGNPFGLDRTLTTGVISGLQRPIRARNNRPIDAAIQTDASINPGNSGGPLLDKYGKLIGINSQILSPAGGSVGVGFAVPVNTAKRVIPQLIQFGEVRRPKLGANLESVAKLGTRYRMPTETGLLIMNVVEGGAASAAGLRGLSRDADGSVIFGDIITSIEGERMNDLDDLFRLLDKKQIGDTVRVEIYRSGGRTVIPLRLIATPQTRTTRRTQD